MPVDAPVKWWKGLSRYQVLVLAVAWLGWVFDIADTALFNFAKTPMITEMLGGKAAYDLNDTGTRIEGQIQTLFFLGWAIGGLVFGVMADRWGRAKTMTLTILLYCGFTGLTALCQTPEHVAAVRFLTAMGIGGEWAAGAALVSEVFPDRARAAAAALLQTAAAFGPVLAALANQALAGESWRWLFLAGIAPAAITVVIRAGVKEPERWVRTQEGKGKGLFEPLKDLFAAPKWRKNALLAMVIGLVGIAGANNFAFWLPNLVQQASQGLDAAVIAVHKSQVTYTQHTGTLLGVLFFPWLCERIGRRGAYWGFFAACPLVLWLALGSAITFESLLWFAPLLSFFTIGLSAGYGLWLPEMFPTRFRATGCSLAYNTARIGQAPFPWITAALIGTSEGNVARGLMLASAVYVVGLIVVPFAPETKGRPLPED